MPNREYIEKQLSISSNSKYPEAIREDALFRAISNSNLSGSEYPSYNNMSGEQVQSYAKICQAFVDGKIDLNEIQDQAAEILGSGLLQENDGQP